MSSSHFPGADQAWDAWEPHEEAGVGEERPWWWGCLPGPYPLASVSVDEGERLDSDCRKDPLSEDPLSPGSGILFKKRKEDENLQTCPLTLQSHSVQ